MNSKCIVLKRNVCKKIRKDFLQSKLCEESGGEKNFVYFAGVAIALWFCTKPGLLFQIVQVFNSRGQFAVNFVEVKLIITPLKSEKSF